jgi:phenylalanyl-tRNA synthetase beta chain
LPAEKRKGRAKPALQATELLPVRRDFAFVVDRSVAAGDVIKAAMAVDKTLISAVGVFDMFEGESLGTGKKSLGIEVTLQPRVKTLTDEEIEAVAKKIIAEVARMTGGAIRS